MLKDNQRRFLTMLVICLLLISNLVLFGVWQIEKSNSQVIWNNAVKKCGFENPVLN